VQIILQNQSHYREGDFTVLSNSGPNKRLALNSIEITEHSTIQQFTKDEWHLIEDPDFVFTDFDFLLSLEESHSVGTSSGWVSKFVAMRTKSQELLAVFIYYEKYHSYGEYIFDWDWANAYEANVGTYYPKILSAIPFTPATGSKLLFNSEKIQSDDAFKVISEFLSGQMDKHKISSEHHLYIKSNELQSFRTNSYAIRTSLQYQWQNNGYKTFAEFLDALKGKKRKNIQKERREIAAQVQLQRFAGDDIQLEHIETMWKFYSLTIEQKHAMRYLTKGFYLSLLESLRKNILICIAYDEAVAVGASICFFKKNTLYGRHWGGLDSYKHLHFELCYYQPLEFAIAKNMTKFEAGAQGIHKWQRGFLPTLTYSAHKFRNKDFQKAIERYVDEEAKEYLGQIEHSEEKSPFKTVHK